MTQKEQLIKKINTLPEHSLKEVDSLIERLIANNRVKVIKKKHKESGTLMAVTGICSGPEDLAESHDQYIYGNK